MNYSKGANRGHHSAPKYDAETGAALQGYGPRRGAVWYKVWKDGVLLGKSPDRKTAEKHAANCGGEVRT